MSDTVANGRNFEVRLARMETQIENTRFFAKFIGWIFAGITTIASALLIGIIAWLAVQVYEIKSTQSEMRATQSEIKSNQFEIKSTQSEIKATVDRIEASLAE
ncbi:MAG: hypothetical protein OXC66_06720 [Roseovarius sp.]|nr:hypothetical protein [Roseovarius sp.]